MIRARMGVGSFYGNKHKVPMLLLICRTTRAAALHSFCDRVDPVVDIVC
jgi:hypothetical protein